MQAPPDLPCYCINLDSRPDKWKDTQRAFEGTGLQLQRVSAVKHAEGWKGCGASHVAIAREAAARGLPWVLVMEDDCTPACGRVGDTDCQPAKDFARRWPAVREALWSSRDSWDIFLGGPTFVEGPVRRIGAARQGLLEVEQGFALHFYVLNTSAYATAAAWNPERDGPIDVYYSGAMRIAASPAGHLALQRPSASDIQGREVDYGREFRDSEEKLMVLAHADRTRVGAAGLIVASAAVLVWLWSRRGTRG
jgi:hypothetical protein